ncbi:MAG: hypothetical protein AAGD00_02145 [Planctomycetota bacterium]
MLIGSAGACLLLAYAAGCGSVRDVQVYNPSDRTIDVTAQLATGQTNTLSLGPQTSWGFRVKPGSKVGFGDTTLVIGNDVEITNRGDEVIEVRDERWTNRVHLGRNGCTSFDLTDESPVSVGDLRFRVTRTY